MKSDYTVREVAELTGVHPETVRRLARAGWLPGGYKFGSRWRFAREAIQELRGQVMRSTYHATPITRPMPAGSPSRSKLRTAR